VDFKPNNSGSDQLREQLHPWSAVIQTVANHVTPSQLSFALTFQSADLGAVRVLLESTKYLPRLRSCALSIGSHKNLEVRSFVQAIAAQMMGRVAANSAPFPFEQLPKELRL
jgi:hypothetical protein